MKFQIHTLFYCLNLISTLCFTQGYEDQLLEKFNEYTQNEHREIAILSLDRNIYFGNDPIHFSCVVLDQYLEPSNRYSDILYISLVGNNGSSVDYPFRIGDDGVVNGMIRLPSTIATGNYQVVAHTLFMRNFDFELHNHRIPIYIQNIDDDVVPIMEALEYEVKEEPPVISDAISFTELPGKIQLNISVSKGEYYLISEGFENIQFIAKVNVKKSAFGLSVPKSHLKGQFQRFVLVDENFKVQACLNYFLENNMDGPELNVPNKVGINSPKNLLFNAKENLYTSIKITKGDLENESSSLFKRIYQFFYNLPNDVNLENRMYEELISDSFLREYSGYSARRWESILEGPSINELTYLPERELAIYGRIRGKKPIPKNSEVRLHLFKNDINVIQQIDDEKSFEIKLPDLLSLEGKDLAYLSLYNDDKDLKEEFSLTIDQLNINYHQDGIYDSDSSIISMIDKKRQFKYVLSTFEFESQKQKFFWENKDVDEIYQIDDYIDIGSIEEFIREVLQKTSIKVVDDTMTIRMYSRDQKSLFNNPPVIIIDNRIVMNEKELFDLSLDDVHEIRQVYQLETLKKFGKPFNDGVFIVRTRSGHYGNNQFDLTPFAPFNAYENSSLGGVYDDFAETLAIDFLTKEENAFLMKGSKELGTYTLILESISQNGTYARQIRKILID